MSERTLGLASAVLAAAGVAIASYLLYARQTGGALVCATGGCETVQSSRYAEVVGAPVAALGVAGFLAIGASGLVRADWARLTQAVLALSAVAFSAYLLYVQLAVLHAVCSWCVASDVLAAAVAVLALLRLRAPISTSPHALYGA